MSGGVSSLSDAELMSMLGRSPPATPAAQKSPDNGLSSMSDADLMKALGQRDAPAGADPAALSIRVRSNDNRTAPSATSTKPCSPC